MIRFMTEDGRGSSRIVACGVAGLLRRKRLVYFFTRSQIHGFLNHLSILAVGVLPLAFLRTEQHGRPHVTCDVRINVSLNLGSTRCFRCDQLRLATAAVAFSLNTCCTGCSTVVFWRPCNRWCGSATVAAGSNRRGSSMISLPACRQRGSRFGLFSRFWPADRTLRRKRRRILRL